MYNEDFALNNPQGLLLSEFLMTKLDDFFHQGFSDYCPHVYCYLHDVSAVIANGIRAGDPCWFNKGRSSKSRVGFRVRQIPEDGRRIYRPKRGENNNKDENNSPKTLNDKNYKDRYAIKPKQQSIETPMEEDYIEK